MRTNLIRNTRGFTFVEIVSVLVMLAVLGAIAVPKFTAVQQESEIKALDIALADMNQRGSLAYSKSMLENDGVAVATDLDSFADFGLGSTALINETYQDFIGTWSYVNATRINYALKFSSGGCGSTVVYFSLTPGTSTSPPQMVLVR